MSKRMRGWIMAIGILVVIATVVFVIVYVLPWLGHLDLSNLRPTTAAEQLSAWVVKATGILGALYFFAFIALGLLLIA